MFSGLRKCMLITVYFYQQHSFRRYLLIMHTKGPIVRISPHEVSISDPDYIDEIFTGATKKRDRDRSAQRYSNGQFMVPFILCELDLTPRE